MRIAILCTAHTGDVWTAESVNTGIGGSEEAVIHTAELLGQRGHQVSVNIPGAQGQKFGSVRYDDYNSLCGQVIDVGVMWRFPEFAANLAASPENFGLPANFKFCARRSYLWLHDDMQAERVLGNAHLYHKVMVLSNAHRQFYSQLPDDRILVSSNGIDLAQFDSDENERDPYLIVYGSDYERGLATLLSSWPAIKKSVPQCRLNVFYGWQTVETLFPERAKVLHRELDPLLCQPDVTHLGRINHQAVATQYMRAGVWAYPCRYLEISCISAMKAQAGGAIPVVIPMGALREVVQFGFHTHRGYDGIAPTEVGELETEWLDGLITLLSSPAEQTRIRQTMIPPSKARFSWSAVADQWEREFTESSPHAVARHDLAVPGAVTARPAICLNAIVKNEAHIIREMLDSVAPYISSWVIVDTGSNDGTQDLIRNHMAHIGIPGELHERPWRNFSHNRTEALNLAQGHGDYIWVMDADDAVMGTPDFTRLDADIYGLRCKNRSDIYWRSQLFRDGVRVHYEGVLTAVLEAESQVFQVGINFADAVKLTGASAPEATARRTPDAGRYVLTEQVACGPAMFDTARLDRAGGVHDSDPDPIAALGRRAAAARLGTASLDEVLCIAAV
jgi:glycosyltransferase involved in cell wall biosynthesis